MDKSRCLNKFTHDRDGHLATEIFAVAVLIVGVVVGIGCIVAVQRKYNNGVF